MWYEDESNSGVKEINLARNGEVLKPFEGIYISCAPSLNSECFACQEHHCSYFRYARLFQTVATCFGSQTTENCTLGIDRPADGPDYTFAPVFFAS